MRNDKNFRPDRIGAYFRIEWLPLALVTVSGLIYNIGLLAAPWFEGRLAQCLADILDGSATAAAMAILVLTYVLVTLVVQAARFIKALSYTDTRKLITLSENGCIPDPEQLVRDNIMWSYWCVWEGEFVLKAAGFNNYSEQYTEKNMLKKAYKSDTVITRKELPDLRNYPLGD